MVTLQVNGKTRQADVPPDTPLLWTLRDVLGLTGTKYGCGMALCGACTVHLDGQPIRSCITPVSAVGNSRIVTLAGLGTSDKPHPLSDSLRRGAGAAMRILHQRLDHDGRRLLAREEEADRG